MGSRREHEGRVPQPGVPQGPRNTPPTPVAGPYRSQSSVPKIRKAATKGEHRKIKVKIPPTPAPIPTTIRSTRLPPPPAGTRPGGVGGSPSAVLHALGDVYSAVSHQQPGADLARKYVKDEAENLADVAKASLKPRPTGAVKIPSSKELQAAATLATPVLAGEGTGEKALAKAASNASSASTVAKAGEKVVAKIKAAPKKKLQDIRTAPKRAATRVKETPARVRSAPARAKRAATTPAGRRGAAKSVGRHPIKSGVPVAAASPVPLPGELDKRARAFVKGTADAVIQHPGEVAETTGHGVLGFLTAPLALAGAGISSIKQGSPAPLVQEGSTLAKGTAKMASNLASGNEKKVEQTTLKETGLTPFIPVPHVVKRLKGTKAYEDSVRGALRGTVEGRRGKTRARRIAAERAATEAGTYVSKKKARKVRLPVPDSSRLGESYVLRRTGKLIEKQRSRHYVSREAARIQEEGNFAAKKHSESIAKPMRKSPGTNRKEQNDGEALAVILKHGLPLNERTLAFAERLKKGYGEAQHGDVPTGVHLDRHSVQWILDHPEMFKGKRGKRLTEAVEAFDKQSRGVGTSARHQYLAQINNLINPIRAEEGKAPILLPEEKVPADTRALLPKRAKEWSRGEALTFARETNNRELATKINTSLKGLMKPPEHGGAEGGISTTRANAYTPQMEKEFLRQVEPETARLGLRKPAAYVKDVIPSGLKGEDKAPNFASEIPLRKIWPSRGLAAKSGNAESSFESLMQHSVEGPRQRDALLQGLNRIFDKATRKVDGKRLLTRNEVERAINSHNVPEGTIFVRTQALKSLLEGEHTLGPEEFRRALMEEVEHGQKLSAKDELAGELEAAKGLKGEKFAPMDAHAIHELLDQMEPLGKVSKGFAHTTNFTTRTILNSPAFAAIQIPQEGLPLAASLGRDVVNVPAAIGNLNKIAKLPIEDQAAIKAVVGSSVGVLGAPATKALKSETFMNPVRAAAGTPAWRHAWEVVNGTKLGRFDRARAGVFREVAADAKVQGDFKRASSGFAKWRVGADNLFKGEQEAVKAMQGMDRAERLAYTAAHPRLGDKLMVAMNNMAGNWNSFTAFEKHLAPLTLFYPFQRYSVLWMLYHFPLDHPVVATALTAMGQVNAQELQARAAREGGTPGILDYTMPVVQQGPGKEPIILPAGQRTFPGLSTLQQAAVSGKPSQLLGELSPIAGIPIEAAVGKNSYTGQPLGENGWEYMLRQAGNLSPLLRFIGVPALGQKPSAASQAFSAQDPLRKFRSTIDPFIGQTAKQYGKTKKLEKGFNDKYSNPVPSLPAQIWEAAYNKDWKLAKELRAKRIKAEKGGDIVKKAEEPFFKESGELGDEGSKILQYITGTIQIPVETPKEKRKTEKEKNPFGLPSTDTSKLQEEFGIPSTSAAELEKQFGIK